MLSRHRVQLEEKLDVANQVREAELHANVEVAHELAVRREIVAAEDTVKLLAQDVDQDVGASRLVDAKDGVEVGKKAPGPEFVAALLVPSLVDVNRLFVGKSAQQLCVRCVESATRFLDDLGDHSCTERHSKNFTEKGLGRRVGAVASALEVRDRCGEREARPVHRCGPRAEVCRSGSRHSQDNSNRRHGEHGEGRVCRRVRSGSGSSSLPG